MPSGQDWADASTVSHAAVLTSQRQAPVDDGARNTNDRRPGVSQPPWHSICHSAAWLKTLDVATRCAQASDPVSIVGECGTGKRQLASYIQSISCVHRAVRVRCGKLVAELAAGIEPSWAQWNIDLQEVRSQLDTTWLLEGVDEIPHTYQSLMCEFVAEIRRQPRTLPIVCTSKTPLLELLESGRIREDLYYSLGVLELVIPPLRERPGDILSLVNHFSAKGNNGLPPIQFSRQAIDMLSAHNWPGNITELRNLVARVRVLADGAVIDCDRLTAIWKLRRRVAADLSSLNLEEAETQLILKAVERASGNKTAAAKHLGITARTLYSKMQKYKSLGLIDDVPSQTKPLRPNS